MGNTVGSRGIKTLSKRQEAIFVGKILGDGTIEKNGNFSRLRIVQSSKQKEYVFWMYKELKILSTKKPRFTVTNNERGISCQYRFDTYSLPVIDKYRKLFYENGKKIVPKNICKLLTSPVSLAVWYMDDGYKRTDNSGLYLCTSSFTNEDNILLQNCLFDNFGLETNLHYAGGYVRIHIPSRHIGLFCKYISPYLVKSMFYKIPLTL